MKAEQGPRWGCDPECQPRADTALLALALRFGGEA